MFLDRSQFDLYGLILDLQIWQWEILATFGILLRREIYQRNTFYGIVTGLAKGTCLCNMPFAMMATHQITTLCLYECAVHE